MALCSSVAPSSSMRAKTNGCSLPSTLACLPLCCTWPALPWSDAPAALEGKVCCEQDRVARQGDASIWRCSAAVQQLVTRCYRKQTMHIRNVHGSTSAQDHAAPVSSRQTLHAFELGLDALQQLESLEKPVLSHVVPCIRAHLQQLHCLDHHLQAARRHSAWHSSLHHLQTSGAGTSAALVHLS